MQTDLTRLIQLIQLEISGVLSPAEAEELVKLRKLRSLKKISIELYDQLRQKRSIQLKTNLINALNEYTIFHERT